MTVEQIRNWLGVFFLGTTALLGGYIILFQETSALPISSKDATSAFQIIIPTFIAQITTVYRWYANPPQNGDAQIELPKWVVLGPPMAVVFILSAAIIVLIIDGGKEFPGGALFKNAVTFCVSLLSASSVLIVTRVFADRRRSANRRQSK